MDNSQIKYRQWIEEEQSFHYWGFLGEGFTNPKVTRDSEKFTGYYDREGDEIWEGDVFQCDDEEDEARFVVRYDLERAAFMRVGNGWSNHMDRFCFDEIYVKAGNIHENPELVDWI